MTEKTPMGRLKVALVACLIHQIENGPVVIDKETGEALRVSAPANILAVAAKVVKDFHDEVASDPSVAELDQLVHNYRLRKGGEARAN